MRGVGDAAVLNALAHGGAQRAHAAPPEPARYARRRGARSIEQGSQYLPRVSDS